MEVKRCHYFTTCLTVFFFVPARTHYTKRQSGAKSFNRRYARAANVVPGPFIHALSSSQPEWGIQWQDQRCTLSGHAHQVHCPSAYRRGWCDLHFFTRNTDKVRSQKAFTSGPISAHQRNAIRMAFRWWADSGPRWYAGCEIVKRDFGT